MCRQTSITELKDVGQLFQGEEESRQLIRNGRSYEVVSTMMYLTGVEKKYFDEHEPCLAKQYGELDGNADARIIRDLCIMRNCVFRNFVSIIHGILYEMKNLGTMPELIPSECVKELAGAGITFRTGGKFDLNEVTVKVNQELSNRIHTVRELFPEWIKWDYVKMLFLMPGGSKVITVKKEASRYNTDRGRFPYRTWVNWNGDGKLFRDDELFATELYEANGDVFKGGSLVKGTDSGALMSMHEFIENHRKVMLVVDCENSDPVKLAAALIELDASQAAAIGKIMMFDSANTTPAWEVLCNTGITKKFTVERKTVSTLYDNKSQVDMQLAVDVTKAVYTDSVDGVMLASSDSDYWTLIKSLPGTDFLVMLEKMKSGNVIRDALESKGYRYCFIDDFCTARAYSLKTETILGRLQKRIDSLIDFNVKDMLEEEAGLSWLCLTEKEADNLFDRYLKNMRLKVQSDGSVKALIG